MCCAGREGSSDHSLGRAGTLVKYDTTSKQLRGHGGSIRSRAVRPPRRERQHRVKAIERLTGAQSNPHSDTDLTIEEFARARCERVDLRLVGEPS